MIYRVRLYNLVAAYYRAAIETSQSRPSSKILALIRKVRHLLRLGLCAIYQALFLLQKTVSVYDSHHLPHSQCRFKTQSSFVAPMDKATNPDEKVVVTQKGIDDWRAQLYGIDLNQFPRQKPADCPDNLYFELMKKYNQRGARTKKSTQGQTRSSSRLSRDAQERMEAVYLSVQNKRGPSEFTPIVMHRDKQVESLIEDLEPSKELLEKRAELERKARDEYLHKLEQQRIEMRNRQKMDLTFKQRKHAEKLFYSLNGSVSRKEIVDSALNVKNTPNKTIEIPRKEVIQENKPSSQVNVEKKNLKRPKSSKQVQNVNLKRQFIVQNPNKSQGRNSKSVKTYSATQSMKNVLGQSVIYGPTYKIFGVSQKFVNSSRMPIKQRPGTAQTYHTKQTDKNYHNYRTTQATDKSLRERSYTSKNVANSTISVNPRSITAKLVMQKADQANEARNEDGISSVQHADVEAPMTFQHSIHREATLPSSLSTTNILVNANQALKKGRPVSNRNQSGWVKMQLQKSHNRCAMTAQLSAALLNETSTTGNETTAYNTRTVNDESSAKVVLKNSDDTLTPGFSVPHIKAHLERMSNTSDFSFNKQNDKHSGYNSVSNFNLDKTLRKEKDDNQRAMKFFKGIDQRQQPLNKSAQEIALNLNEQDSEIAEVFGSETCNQDTIGQQTETKTDAIETIQRKDPDYRLKQSFSTNQQQWSLDCAPKRTEAQKNKRILSSIVRAKHIAKDTQGLLDPAKIPETQGSPIAGFVEERSEKESAHKNKGQDQEKYELPQEMFRDESDEEDEQINFEMDSHFTEWINVISAHTFRAEIRKNIEDDLTLSEQERKRWREQNRGADMWVQKGIEINQAHKVQGAIPCYKQALKMNPRNFLAMFNIGCNYERLQKFGSALKWFYQASKVKVDFERAHQAAGLNFFKLGRYEQAMQSFQRCLQVYEELKKGQILQENKSNKTLGQNLVSDSDSEENTEKSASLEQADLDPKDRATSKSYQAHIHDCNFWIAVCLRRLGRFKEAGDIYLKLARFIRYNERQDLINSLFGVILLPMTKDRRMILNELEILRDSLEAYKEIKNPIMRPLHGTFFDPKSKAWLFPEDAAKELITRSFFKRFKLNEVQDFLSKMTVKRHPVGSVIFPDNQICVILEGLVESKQHVAGERVPRPFNKFQAGDILGFDKGDNGQTSNSNTWSICQSEVEAIWIEKSDFESFWAIQNKKPQKILCNFIRNQACFSSYTEVTLHLLAFELLQTRRYKAGEVILRQNKRSVVNEFHLPYMESQTNALMISAMKEREKVDRFGYDQRVSNFQLLLGQVARRAKQTLDRRNTRKTLMQQQPIDAALLAQLSKFQNLSSESSEAESKPLQAREVGLFVLDQGRAQIIYQNDSASDQDEEGAAKKMHISEISRSDAFGASGILKQVSLDYFGDIIAGSKFSKHGKEIVCLYLEANDFKRIHESEMRQFKLLQEGYINPFMRIAARQHSKSLEDLNIY